MLHTRLATSVCQLRHDQMEQGPTEPHAGRSTFLLSFGGAGGGYYSVASHTGPIPTENQFPCQTLVACLLRTVTQYLCTESLLSVFPDISERHCTVIVQSDRGGRGAQQWEQNTEGAGVRHSGRNGAADRSVKWDGPVAPQQQLFHRMR